MFNILAFLLNVKKYGPEIMRKKLHKLHAYFALASLIPLIIIAVTGSLLVFKFELDTLLLPEVASISLPVEQQENTTLTRLNINELVTQINQQFSDYEIGSWELFDDKYQADRVYLLKRYSESWFKIHLNPYSGEVLSTPVPIHHDLTDWLVQLHFTFLLNDLGFISPQLGTIIGLIASIIMTFLGISGLIIYRKFWRRFFKFRWDAKLAAMMSDLHKLVGIWCSPIILILGITGGYFNFIEYWHETFEHGEEAHHIMTDRLYNAELDFQQLLTTSTEKITSFTPQYLLFPFEPKMAWTVFGSIDTNNPFASAYGSTVSFNAMTGKYLSHYDIRTSNTSTQVFDSFRTLHYGNFAGLWSKIIWCVMGLSPLILGASGFYLWYSRIRRKRVSKQS
ncbi:PepSY-associated TM helix domain-containing protein [Colwellia asteriadis]|uniref:PepSY-associated TM helix domain-containing protein n=2 Tax=Colwellia asteriadis TaxID=517723 RepID=A0ABP3WH26_9GAMM